MKIISDEYLINNSDVGPDPTTVNLGNKNAIFGVGHNLSALATHNVIAGEGHIVTDTEDASHQAIFGFANEVKDNYGGLVAGTENKITSTMGTIYNYLFGGNVQVTAGGGWNFIFGNGTQVSCDGVISLGGNSNIFTMDYAIGLGRSLDIQKTTTEICGVAIGNVVNIRGNSSYGFGMNVATSVDAEYSFALGYQAYTMNYGQHAQASGFFAQQGDAQTSVMVLRKQTTDDTANVELALDGGTKHIKTEDGRSYNFQMELVGRKVGAQDSAYVKWSALFTRGTGFATCLMPYDTYTNYEDAGLSGVAYDVDIDIASDGHIKIMVTGLSATTINWVARVTLTEVKV